MISAGNGWAPATPLCEWSLRVIASASGDLPRTRCPTSGGVRTGGCRGVGAVIHAASLCPPHAEYGEGLYVSKIDEAISAIQAAMSQLNETLTAIGTAGAEADEAYQGAAALGADGVAQAMSQCKEALDKASGACGSVSDTLESAVSAAQSASG